MSNEQRTAPPSHQPNNQDVFIWALYLLGGADRKVDVEEIYLKCFELAPARYGWRTQPQIPDYKKISKALQSVEAKTHVGIVLKVDEYNRRLTNYGAQWVDRWKAILENNYSGQPVAASAAHNQYEMARVHAQRSPIWIEFQRGSEHLDLAEVAWSLGLSPASPKSSWENRIALLIRAAEVLGDESLKLFAEVIEDSIVRKMK